jgi:hypothetical protein
LLLMTYMQAEMIARCASWRSVRRSAALSRNRAAGLVAALRPGGRREEPDVENIQYPADWLAKGGRPYESMGLRKLPAPLIEYTALTLVRDGGAWKVVVGADNTVLGEADLDNIMEYISTYAWHVEDAERRAGGS